jgi:hypothetical protein
MHVRRIAFTARIAESVRVTETSARAFICRKIKAAAAATREAEQLPKINILKSRGGVRFVSSFPLQFKRVTVVEAQLEPIKFCPPGAHQDLR